MRLIESRNLDGVLRRTVPRCLLLALAVLAGCSGDRVWRRIDPLGYSRAHDAPYLYREKGETTNSLPPLVNDRPSRTYFLPDP
ncbi:hypothetical protein [Prosthecobacter sp.]|uniref:hypothetical protein n=1 Tax=Prosthecobacter sp. TaxID=1965333 RepID=UPI002AB99EE6|nr:hypothetical protein [Prosthecobacter sp.]MDZ4403507.1 hypothetical protein [Prosthecobacter sp.]